MAANENNFSNAKRQVFSGLLRIDYLNLHLCKPTYRDPRNPLASLERFQVPPNQFNGLRIKRHLILGYLFVTLHETIPTAFHLYF